MDGKDGRDNESTDKGLSSSLAGYDAGQYMHHESYPPHGCFPQGYPPQGYPPPGGCPPAGYYIAGQYMHHGSYLPYGYHPHGFPPQGYTPPEYPPPGGNPPAGYPPPPAGYPPAFPQPEAYLTAAYAGPSAPYHSGHGPGMGARVAGGLTAATAAHHMSHCAHQLGHGPMYGHCSGKFTHIKFKRTKQSMLVKYMGKFFKRLK